MRGNNPFGRFDGFAFIWNLWLYLDGREHGCRPAASSGRSETEHQYGFFIVAGDSDVSALRVITYI